MRNRVPQGAFERLEPCEGRLSCTVLRGRGGGNAALLPDKKGKVYPRRNVPDLPSNRDWNDLLQCGQSLASALFKRTGDETYKKVRRTLERLGRDVAEGEAKQRRLPGWEQ